MLTVLQSAESAEQSTLNLERTEALRRDLERWRVSIPNHLVFKDVTPDTNDSDTLPSLYDWKARQQSGLRIRQSTFPYSCHVLVNVFLSIGLLAEKIIILPTSFYFGAPL